MVSPLVSQDILLIVPSCPQTCIIDWESTTTRPLWQCAHVPSFLQSSPFTAKLFRATVEKLARAPSPSLAQLAATWLHLEATGARLRMAHRCIEWDGWEDGLVASMLGPEDQEEDWFREWQADDREPTSHNSQLPDLPEMPELLMHTDTGREGREGDPSPDSDAKPESPVASISPSVFVFPTAAGVGEERKANAVPVPKVVVAVEKEREKLLNATGDICGGRGGELGRRLEAWLYVNGDADGRVELGRRWEGEEDEAEP